MHGAKGLEDDYVVVLGLCAGRYGFPSEMADDPLLDLVLAESEGHPNAEERRLLYVALTRARYRAYLLVEGGEPSVFVKELMAQDGVETFGRALGLDVPCCECATGHLVRRQGEGGKTFYGCSNFPFCERTERACPDCGEGLQVREGEMARCQRCRSSAPACPSCDGVLRERRGRYGPFLGCSNYPSCGYTRENRQRQATPSQSNA